ncbi:MAG: hypothetical protein HYU31_11775 [Deltaproteobacteria bacterium]|nr:hypothetical protein [Deltaproteobacteria bacterium]MBI2231991.1 hypothetical protein [Deltaproteobacteria bacterium]
MTKISGDTILISVARFLVDVPIIARSDHGESTFRGDTIGILAGNFEVVLSIALLSDKKNSADIFSLCVSPTQSIPEEIAREAAGKESWSAFRRDASVF